MSLICRTHVRMTRLRFPFAVRVQAVQGMANLRDANARRVVRPGDPFVVPAFAHFDCDLPGLPWQPCAMTFTAVPDAWCPRMAVIQLDRRWSRTLAELVFEQPALAWNAALLGERWQIPPRHVRARLFAEGEALHALVREQRAARAFYALALPDGHANVSAAALQTIARQAGMRSAAAFGKACASLFGVELAQLMSPAVEAASARPMDWLRWSLPSAA